MGKICPRQQLLYQLGLGLVGLFVLLPIWVMGYMAFDGALKGGPVEARLWPEAFTLEVFRKVWDEPLQALTFTGLLKNSLVVAGGSALTAVAFGASMAYAFARYRFPGRQAGLFSLLVGAFLPPVALMTPLYLLLESIHLRTSLLGLMIVYTSFSMPFCIWNMRASFQAVPKDLEEAAFLDGAGPFSAFWQVTLPLALPSIAVAALVAFLVGYSEFAIGWLFVESSRNVTLAMAVSGMLRQTGGSAADVSALAILMSTPVVAIFLVLHRFLMDRFLIGNAAG
jgi:arabinogalactan oligomer / maltooligosaccharide transport system permease protein